MKCLVENCKSQDNRKHAGIFFHRIPQKSEIQKKWLEKIRLPIFNVRSRICSLHFIDSDYETIMKRRILKKDAIPSQQLHQADYDLNKETQPKQSLMIVKKNQQMEEAGPACNSIDNEMPIDQSRTERLTYHRYPSNEFLSVNYPTVLEKDISTGVECIYVEANLDHRSFQEKELSQYTVAPDGSGNVISEVSSITSEIFENKLDKEFVNNSPIEFYDASANLDNVNTVIANYRRKLTSKNMHLKELKAKYDLTQKELLNMTNINRELETKLEKSEENVKEMTEAMAITDSQINKLIQNLKAKNLFNMEVGKIFKEYTNLCINGIDITETNNAETSLHEMKNENYVENFEESFSEYEQLSAAPIINCTEDNELLNENQNSTTNDFYENEDVSELSSLCSSRDQNDSFYQYSKDYQEKKRNYIKVDGGYQCEICMKILTNISGYLRHSVSHKQQTTLCFRCGINFESHVKWRVHEAKFTKKNKCPAPIVSHGESSNTKKCTYCSFYVKANYKYHEHISFHTKERPYICSCGKNFRQISKFYSHVFRLNNKEQKCKLENSILPSYAPTYMDIHNNVKINLDKKKKYVCHECDKQFPIQLQFYDHFNSHTNEKPYICSCNAQFSYFYTFRGHMLNNSLCSIDNSTIPEYVSQSLIKRLKNPVQPKAKTNSPIKTKLKRATKNYFCAECNIDFQYNGRKYRQHYSTNHCEKKFVCKECNRIFQSNLRLNIHVKAMHLYRYKCEICSQLFSKFYLYNRHIARKHNLESSNNYVHTKSRKKYDKSQYNCNICQAQFKTNFSFLKHLLRDDHIVLESIYKEKYAIENYSCKYCNNTSFKSLHLFLTHCTQHHKRLNLIKNFESFEKSVSVMANTENLALTSTSLMEIDNTNYAMIDEDDVIYEEQFLEESPEEVLICADNYSEILKEFMEKPI